MEMQLNSKQLDLLLDTVDFEKARGDRAKTRLENLKAYIAQVPPLMMKILAVYILDWDLSKKEDGEANWDIPLWIGNQADRDKIFRSLTLFSAMRKLAGELGHSEYIYREFPKKVLFTIKTGSESTAKCVKILSDSLKEVSLIISLQLIESVKASLNNVKNTLNQVSIHMPQGDSSFVMMSDILQEAKRIQVAISKNVLKGFDNSESEGLRSDLRRGLQEALDLPDETTIISEKNVTEFINLQLLTFAIFDTEGLVLRAYTFVPSRGIMRAGRVDSSGGLVFILKKELCWDEKVFFSLLADSWKRQDAIDDVSKRAAKQSRDQMSQTMADSFAHGTLNLIDCRPIKPTEFTIESCEAYAHTVDSLFQAIRVHAEWLGGMAGYEAEEPQNKMAYQIMADAFVFAGLAAQTRGFITGPLMLKIKCEHVERDLRIDSFRIGNIQKFKRELKQFFENQGIKALVQSSHRWLFPTAVMGAFMELFFNTYKHSHKDNDVNVEFKKSQVSIRNLVVEKTNREEAQKGEGRRGGAGRHCLKTTFANLGYEIRDPFDDMTLYREENGETYWEVILKKVGGSYAKAHKDLYF